MKIHICFIVFILIAPVINSPCGTELLPVQTDTIRARRYLEKGTEFLNDARYDSSMKYLEQSKTLYQNALAQEDRQDLWTSYEPNRDWL